MNGFIDFALKSVVGIPDNVVADLDRTTPAMARLAALEQRLGPIINKPQTLEQHIAAIVPLVMAEYPDIKSVLPVVAELVSFATKQS